MLPPPGATLTPAECALANSLVNPEFRDVHLYAFTRRSIHLDGTCRIGKPLPILAVGSVLKDTEYFANLLTAGFAESHASPDTIRQYALDDDYDYESDSDLDEVEEQWDPSDPVPGGSGGTSKSYMAVTSYSPSSEGKGKSRELVEDDSNPQTTPNEDQSKTQALHRGILLPSVAHRTLRAFIFYLYTAKVNFLPLRSGGLSHRQLALFTAGATKAPPCSPKSMYRLAELYGMPRLQDLAYDAILAQLSPTNIVDEAFSQFFARYDKLREHAVSYLSQNYSHPKVQASLQNTLDRVLLGILPHAGPLLRSLLGLRVAVAQPSKDSSTAQKLAVAPRPPNSNSSSSPAENPFGSLVTQPIFGVPSPSVPPPSLFSSQFGSPFHSTGPFNSSIGSSSTPAPSSSTPVDNPESTGGVGGRKAKKMGKKS
ncbi:hypothetical protein BC628DRAFT_1311282 [Trametes gibbosa]|nr:hypothetical protein BC628DRAFT_1311282 [Trametes gibbosa]